MSGNSNALLPVQKSQPEAVSEKTKEKEEVQQQQEQQHQQVEVLVEQATEAAAGAAAMPPLGADENVPSTSRQVTPETMPQPTSKPPTPPPARTAKTRPTPVNGPAIRIRRELTEITQQPPPNCSAELYKDDLFHWRATILGPTGTVYENGTFRLDIRFPAAYPFRPPQIRFITRIYHCNVDSRGVICLDVLNERWSPVMNIAKVLLSIWVLISECNPLDPLVMGIADQYQNNRKEHDKIARFWTRRFAMDKTARAQLKQGLKQDEKQDEAGPSLDEQSEEESEAKFESAEEGEQEPPPPRE